MPPGAGACKPCMPAAAPLAALALLAAAGAPAALSNDLANVTACLLRGLPRDACGNFSLFNQTECLAQRFEGRGGSEDPEARGAGSEGAAAAPPPRLLADASTADALACLNASGCLPLYGVPDCVGPRGYNLSLAQFNYSTCVPFAAALNLTFGNGTGCEALGDYVPPDAGLVNDTLDDLGGVQLPTFHACSKAFEDPKYRNMQFSRLVGIYSSHMVVGLSPDMGPVAGGVSVGVCGVGFPMSNEAVNRLKCRFSDGYYTLATPAVYVDRYMLRCVSPDFSNFAVGLPHRVSVEVSVNRGEQWSSNGKQFTMYSTRPAIDAFGRPMWGYESTFEKSSWQLDFEQNDLGFVTPPLYEPTGHPLNGGVPSEWDARRDPFHASGPGARERPVEDDVGDRMEPAEDVVVRAELSRYHGVEGSWGDRASFLRAHHLVRDVYRQDVVEARREVAGISGANGVV